MALLLQVFFELLRKRDSYNAYRTLLVFSLLVDERVIPQDDLSNRNNNTLRPSLLILWHMYDMLEVFLIVYRDRNLRLFSDSRLPATQTNQELHKFFLLHLLPNALYRYLQFLQKKFLYI